ncbi:hypothetical protein MHBO_005286 [Bonamia ostreae]|uniref:Ribosomal protein L32 n=1 Tax=Bonamia ostreae TaxID=126728 RepID=A0ABV2AQY8_9EUKA
MVTMNDKQRNKTQQQVLIANRSNMAVVKKRLFPFSSYFGTTKNGENRNATKKQIIKLHK